MNLKGIQSMAKDDYNKLIISFEPPLQSTRVRATSLKHPPDIFRDLTENRSIFRSTPENGPFSGFFSDTKIWTFLEMLFPKNSRKKVE
jgi:hypothetical protein